MFDWEPRRPSCAMRCLASVSGRSGSTSIGGVAGGMPTACSCLTRSTVQSRMMQSIRRTAFGGLGSLFALHRFTEIRAWRAGRELVGVAHGGRDGHGRGNFGREQQ